MLLPANLDRLVIHFLFVPLKLARGVDGFSFSSVGIVVENNDNFIALIFLRRLQL
jgi:hypothetical protein